MRPAHFKILTVALTALFMWGDFARFAHFASVRHRVCAEHGELEDVAEHSAIDRSDVPAGEQVVPLPCGVHEHEHCPLIDKHRDTRAPHTAIVRVRIAPVDVRELLPSAAAVTLVGFPRYQLAPKHSPPA